MTDTEAGFRDSLRAFKDTAAAPSGSGVFGVFESFQRSATSTLSTAGQGVLTTVKSAVPTRLTDALTDPVAASTCGLTRFQRMMAFFVLLLAGGGCLVLAFFTLPMVVLRPAKFAISYSVGHVLLLSSIAMLIGPVTFAKQLVASERIVVTSLYLGSLGLTVYTAIALYRLLFLVSVIFQLVIVLWLVASAFPGGVTALNFAASLFARSARTILPI